jgi:hypothetical protein
MHVRFSSFSFLTYQSVFHIVNRHSLQNMNNTVDYYDLCYMHRDYIDSLNMDQLPLKQKKKNWLKDKKRDKTLTQINFFTCTYNAFVCVVTLMLRRRERARDNIIEGICNPAHTHPYMHTYTIHRLIYLFLKVLSPAPTSLSRWRQMAYAQDGL